MKASHAIIAVATLTTGGLSISPAEAAPRSAGSVTACSRFGHGCTTAPVRRGGYGWEVRLPGGTWISCARDCATTLRDETIDFWSKRDWERGGGEGRRRN